MSVLQFHASHKPFRHIGLFLAAAGVIAIAGLGGWLELRSEANLVSPTGTAVDPSQIMIDGKELPAQQMIDFSLIFE